LKQFPWLNSQWTEEGIVLKHYVNMGIAVAIPDGLIVPVLKDADQMGFTDLVRALNDLVERARNKQLKPDDVQGGTFTLNNTGATGSLASQPIINQPQAAILTTESILKKPVVIGDGIAIRHMMNMCMSFDHRIVPDRSVWNPAEVHRNCLDCRRVCYQVGRGILKLRTIWRLVAAVRGWCLCVLAERRGGDTAGGPPGPPPGSGPY